jgi:hypothetical protein
MMRNIASHLASAGLILLAVVLGGIAGGEKVSHGTNNTVLSSITPYFGTSTVGSDVWHNASYGEDGLDLFVPAGSDGYFAGYVQSQYLYWESSNYGSEGGATSGCTGKVYQVWWSNGGVWTAAILQNVVHLQDGKAANTYDSIAPYGQIGSWAGRVANSQNCDYDQYHFHDTRNLYWGNGARGSVTAYNGASVPTSTEILRGRD